VSESEYQDDQRIHSLYQNLIRQIRELEPSLHQTIVDYADWLTDKDPSGMLPETKNAELFLDMLSHNTYSFDVSHDIDLGTVHAVSYFWDEHQAIFVPSQWFEDREAHSRYIDRRLEVEAENEQVRQHECEVIELEAYRQLKAKYENA